MSAYSPIRTSRLNNSLPQTPQSHVHQTPPQTPQSHVHQTPPQTPQSHVHQTPPQSPPHTLLQTPPANTFNPHETINSNTPNGVNELYVIEMPSPPLHSRLNRHNLVSLPPLFPSLFIPGVNANGMQPRVLRF